MIDLHTLARCFVRKRRNWCCCFLFLFFSLEIPGVPIFTWFSFSLAGNRVEADRTGSKARNNVLIGPRNGIRHRLRHIAPYLAPIAQFHHLSVFLFLFFFFISLSIFFFYLFTSFWISHFSVLSFSPVIAVLQLVAVHKLPETCVCFVERLSTLQMINFFYIMSNKNFIVLSMPQRIFLHI